MSVLMRLREKPGRGMMSRLVFVDTETTGISWQTERVLEVAAIEVVSRVETGRQIHEYINPEKEVGEGAFKVHGISLEMVKDKPVFAHFAKALIEMLAGSTFVAHNATFDAGFLNSEFKRAGHSFVIGKDCEILDTLKLAKTLYPGQKNSLDALCNRLSIDRSNRVLHGALLDTQLLVQVYIAMTQKQERFSLKKDQYRFENIRVDYLQDPLSPEDEARHQLYMESL